MTSRLLAAQSVPIPTGLAVWIAQTFARSEKRRDKGYAGNCAAFVQQIHFYITLEFGSIPSQVKQMCEDGRRWIYKSYESWRTEVFPWLSDYAFRKVRSLLVGLGLIEVKQLGLRQQGRDRTCWYTVNYNHPFLQQLLSTDAQRDNSTDADGSNSTDATVSSSTTPSVDCQRIPITTSNTTGNTLSQEANQKEKKVEPEPEITAGSSVDSTAKSDFPRPKPKISLCDKSSAPLVEAWEVAPQQPYPYFLQWRALHYKNQGGHWANSPQSNAYAEFYKNRFKTQILWQEFLQFYNLALDNALALQAAGIEVRLPSCLSEVESANEQQIAQKARTLSSNPTQPKAQIAPDPNFSARLGALVRQRTLLQPQPELSKPNDSLQQYLSWLHGDEPVLVEEARKKLTRLVMERSDLLAVWDEQGRLINVEFSKLISNSASYEPK
ncbi:hypothetical protein C7B79_24885 [Chroococcidiopsis cubana CCALA 043]|uniref:hypothetical protein n=1 Tax=Chroococcidiopsis cubana TaxID=171392 RepID=UPI000D0827BF|nr:hypothetical protein [Chroococcidiopsis cubana]PSB60670.1 hypothetical protein C7B79_24885 [Chroococcidiopsis cubana CCALA 043]